MKLPYKIYTTTTYILYVVYALVFLGLLSTVPHYLYIWNYIVQIGLCVFLMIRYHPFRTVYKFEKNDEKIIFNVAVLLFINLISVPFIIQYLESLKNKVVAFQQELHG
jgi:hypothetical protein